MKPENNKNGFTLRKVIIMIIIVGGLASLALPRFFNAIEYSQSIEHSQPTIEYPRPSEALNAIGILKQAADQCNMTFEMRNRTPDNFAQCDSFAKLGVNNPGLASSAIFSYVINDYVTPNWSIVATRLVPSEAADSTITFTYNTRSGATTRAGTGVYSGFK